MTLKWERKWRLPNTSVRMNRVNNVDVIRSIKHGYNAIRQNNTLKLVRNGF